MSRDAPPAALVNLVRRNRRRYGGYLVHLGIVVLFVGVGASSAFQQATDVELRPGGSVRVDDWEVRYVEPTSRVVAAANGRLERIDLGARLELRRDGRVVDTAHTRRSFFPSADPTLGPVSRFFEGEATSEVALRAGWVQDVWAVVAPDLTRLRPAIEEGDAVFAAAGDDLTAEQRGEFLGQALAGLTERYAQSPPPATFRVLVSPMVTWIWVGAIIVFGGGLVAVWPGAASSRRTVTAGYAARLARELGRA